MNGMFYSVEHYFCRRIFTLWKRRRTRHRRLLENMKCARELTVTVTSPKTRKRKIAPVEMSRRSVDE